MNFFGRQRYIRKYHLEYKLDDGRVWKGFINICKDKPNRFPKVPKGRFWINKDSQGFHGGYELDDSSEILPVCPTIVTTAVYMSDEEFQKVIDDINYQNNSNDYSLNNLSGIYDIKSSNLMLPEFEARIEDCFIGTIEN